MIFVASMISLIAVCRQFWQNKKPELLLLAMWAVFIMLVSGIFYYFGQIRFICYLVPIFSVLFAYLVVKMVEFGWAGLKKAGELATGNHLKKYVELGSMTIIFLAGYFFLYPFPFNAAEPFPYSLPSFLQDMVLNWKFGPADSDRYDVAEWLKNHTPDTGLDYYQLYQEPGIDEETGKVRAYQYPDSAYGILAVWDFGHMITYYSHRIPVANPFQQGIGKKNADGSITPGYATFFLEENESAAIGYLDQLKTKYVIADSNSANSDSVFQQMIKWQQDQMQGYLSQDSKSLDMAKYYSSMIARLSLFDGRKTFFEVGSGEDLKKFDAAGLRHFRLLYESSITDYTLKIDNKQEVKKYKIFEYVKGAVLQGKAATGTIVKVSIDVKTNQGRKFTYTNSVAAEAGKFEIAIPYSTGQQEDSDTVAEKCKIDIGSNYQKEIEISETDILNGNAIQL
jgi:dolichyl-diphosphooligosaccharide--protein glycosyltransferase